MDDHGQTGTGTDERRRAFAVAAIRRHNPEWNAERIREAYTRIEAAMAERAPSRGDLMRYGGGLLVALCVRRADRPIPFVEACLQYGIDPVAIADTMGNHLAALDVAIGYLSDAGLCVVDERSEILNHR